jgi:thiosulfate/3-mercaptopyruvate sulfurtransferase
VTEPAARLAPPEGAVLASTAWLEANLALAGTEELCIVDIRGVVRPPGSSPRYLPKRDEYAQGHIPGAVFVDWTRDIVDPGDPVPVQIAPPEPFASAMAALGIGDGTLVVAYDDHDHIFAGRLAWALRYYGHDAVRILDGGWARWVAEGRPTTRDPAHREPSRFTPRPRPTLRRTADEVARALGRDDVLLIDARPADQYAGAVTAAARSGHIPGARNVPYARLVDARTGKFLSRAELAAAFAEAGVKVDALPREVVVYCNGGVSCTVPLAALRVLRPDRDDVAVYDGSWNEWGGAQAEAVARPVKPGQDP